jgi:Ca2+-binding RTX toxin-like protein
VEGWAGNDTLTGGRDNDTLEGGAGHDRLDGGAGDDLLSAGSDGGSELRGGEGADTLDAPGAALASVLIGGLGNDTYLFRGGSDRIIEERGGGMDTLIALQSSGTVMLPAEVENLILLGGAVTGAGNALANRITGNAGANLLAGGDAADTLDGGQGNDTLVGGEGQDVFIIGAGQGHDVLRDFAPGIDFLLLQGSGHASAAAALAAFHAVSGGLELALPGGAAVVLEGMSLGALRASDILIG